MNQQAASLNASKKKAVFYILISCFGFASMSMLVKWSGDLPLMQKSFFRNFIAAFVAFFSMKKAGIKMAVQKENQTAMLARSVFGTIGMLCNYYSVRYLILPDSTILAKLSPFFTILFSWFLLHERVNRRQWMAICISFLGCVLVIQPSFSSGASFPAVVAIVGGATAGIAYSYVRYLTQRGENKSMIIFCFSAFSCLVSVPFLIFNSAPMTMAQLLMLVGSGLAAAVGQFGMTNAYALAPGRFLGPFEYFQLLFSAIYGFAIFGEIPTPVGVLGYAVILAVSLWMLKFDN